MSSEMARNRSARTHQDDSASANKPHTPEKSSKPLPQKTLLMISGKFLTDHLRDNEFDLETVSKTQWPGLSERKNCFLL